MNRLLVGSWLLIGLLINTICAQHVLHIRLVAYEVTDTSTVYISGSHTLLGSWQPGKVALRSAAYPVWHLDITFPEPVSLEYKYTQGSWEKEALTKTGTIPGNRNVLVKGEVYVYDTVWQWKSGQVRPSQGQVTGHVDHFQVKPKGLVARGVHVWLPPDYQKKPRKRYPVLYMHDGQNAFDPSTSSFGVDWQVDETLDSLIRNRKIKPMIVVAVENGGADRHPEYSPGTKGTLYMDFLCQDLKPTIDSAYRTKPQRKHTMVAGSSMGGLISFMLVWERTDVFSKAICMSPAFQYKGFDYLPAVENDPRQKVPIKVYIDNGGIGLETVLQPGIDHMLKALGSKPIIDFKWLLAPEAEHNEKAWAVRMPEALIWLMK